MPRTSRKEAEMDFCFPAFTHTGGFMSTLTIAQLQTHVYEDKLKNVEMLVPLLRQAKEGPL